MTRDHREAHGGDTDLDGCPPWRVVPARAGTEDDHGRQRDRTQYEECRGRRREAVVRECEEPTQAVAEDRPEECREHRRVASPRALPKQHNEQDGDCDQRGDRPPQPERRQAHRDWDQEPNRGQQAIASQKGHSGPYEEETAHRRRHQRDDRTSREFEVLRPEEHTLHQRGETPSSSRFACESAHRQAGAGPRTAASHPAASSRGQRTPRS